MNVSVTVYQPRPPGRAAAWTRAAGGSGLVPFLTDLRVWQLAAKRHMDQHRQRFCCRLYGNHGQRETVPPVGCGRPSRTNVARTFRLPGCSR